MFQGVFFLFWKRSGNWGRWEVTREDLNWEKGGVISFLFCSSRVEEKLSLAAMLLGQ